MSLFEDAQNGGLRDGELIGAGLRATGAGLIAGNDLPT
jgi:hypothetical protein